MDFQPHIQVLRVQLLAMSRLAQCALDYSIKGYELGSSDFCNHARGIGHELGGRYHQIKHLCCQLIIAGTTAPSELRFSLAALRLNRALCRTYSAAAQITKDTLLFLESNPMTKCAALDAFGDLVNSLMRLCIVALFQQEASHAETVLQSQGAWRRYELIFDHLHHGVTPRMKAQDIYALTISQSLGIVARQAHDMAHAILFWMQGGEGAWISEADGHAALDFFIGREQDRCESGHPFNLATMNQSSCESARQAPSDLLSGSFNQLRSFHSKECTA
jgi:hypothetical protein